MRSMRFVDHSIVVDAIEVGFDDGLGAVLHLEELLPQVQSMSRMPLSTVSYGSSKVIAHLQLRQIRSSQAYKERLEAVAVEQCNADPSYRPSTGGPQPVRRQHQPVGPARLLMDSGRNLISF